MQIPKTLWLKNHMSADRFARCQFFDLPDFCELDLRWCYIFLSVIFQ